MIIIDNFCIVLFSDVHKLTALYNTLQHFLSENKIIKGNNVHESNTYIGLVQQTKTTSVRASNFGGRKPVRVDKSFDKYLYQKQVSFCGFEISLHS